MPAIAATVTVLSLGLAACGDGDESGPDSGGGHGGTAALDLVIGDSVPLSGDRAVFGPSGQKAADLALDTIDDAIEATGVDHTVEVVHEDNGDGPEPQAAVQAARRLVTSDGATCIAGAWASPDTIRTAESVAMPREVTMVSPASTSDEITALDDDGLVNRTVPPDSSQGSTLAAYVAEELGGAEGETINIGARDDTYGNGIAETFSAAWEEMGGEIGAMEIYDTGQPDYDAEASAIVGGDPDGIVIIDFPKTYNELGPALARTGDFDPEKTFVTDGLISGDLAESAGADAVDGLRGIALGVPDSDEAEAFDMAYAGHEPVNVERVTFDAQNFDAVVLCYLAAVAAGSTEGAAIASTIRDVSGPGGEEYTWEELPEAIEALEDGEEIDYQGASGPIDMNESGDATAGAYDVYEFKEGFPEQVSKVAALAPE